MRVQLLQTPQKSGRPSVTGCLQAGHGLRQHDGQGIFAGSARACKDERGRHALSRNRLPQMADGRLISGKLVEAHVPRLANCPSNR